MPFGGLSEATYGMLYFSLFFLKVQAASTGIILKDKANNSEKAVASKTRRRSFTIPVFNFYYVLV